LVNCVSQHRRFDTTRAFDEHRTVQDEGQTKFGIAPLPLED
jgi:hypothetical protein